jgi:Raf kinase inhibitor-like YbhB/YbcL family protein
MARRETQCRGISIMQDRVMPRFSMPIAIVALVIGAGSSPGRAAEPFTLTSSAFTDGATLQTKYAGDDPSRVPPCGGENISPPLQWINAPAATKSFAIVMQDPDGGRGTGSNHWVAYDIPPGKTSLREGEASLSPTGWIGGKNTIGTDHYFGPCGPLGDAPHHYVITVIATDLEPGTLKPGLTREALLQQIRGHALAPASIVVKYVRQP